MSETRERQSTNAVTKSLGGLMQNERARRIAIYAAILLGVFLLGLVPMWMTARERGRERDAAQSALRVGQLQNTLANAAIDARRGEYEPARQAASEFFTSLRAEMERGRDSAFTQTQQESLRGMYARRDDAITLLARNDPASAERLTDLHLAFRQALGNLPAANSAR